jgi:acyl-ACP thioesterase
MFCYNIFEVKVMAKYNKKFLIPYYDTDVKGKLKPESVLSYMAETSSWHSDNVGVGHKLLNANGYGWMLNRWEVEIYSLPSAKEEVTVQTWTSGFDKFYAERQFCMKDSSGADIAKASTQWIFLEMGKKRPRRVPDEIKEKYNFINEMNFSEYTELKPFDFEPGKIITTRRSDIDNNNHVNNIRYVEWMFEGIPQADIINKELFKIAIKFNKEIRLGDEVATFAIADSDKTTAYRHIISVKGEINAIGYTEWK